MYKKFKISDYARTPIYENHHASLVNQNQQSILKQIIVTDTFVSQVLPIRKLKRKPTAEILPVEIKLGQLKSNIGCLARSKRAERSNVLRMEGHTEKQRHSTVRHTATP